MSPESRNELIPTTSESQQELQSIIQNLDEQTVFNLLLEEAEKADTPEAVTDGFIPFSEIKVAATEAGSNKSFGSYGKGVITLYANASANHTEKDAIKKTTHASSQALELRKHLSKAQGNPHNEFVKDTLGAAASEALKIAESEFDMEDERAAAYLKLEVLNTLIHEELHGLSDLNWERNYIDGPEGFGFTSKKSIGFKTHEIASIHKTEKIGEEYIPLGEGTVTEISSGTAINEGTTQLLADRLTERYLQRSPISGVSAKFVSEFLHENHSSYPREMQIIETYITILSAFSDVSPKVVENALFRAYFKGESYLPEEIIDLIFEAIPMKGKVTKDEVKKYLVDILGEENFTTDSEVIAAFGSLIEDLPEEKKYMVKDRLAEIFKKYNPHVSLEETDIPEPETSN